MVITCVVQQQQWKTIRFGARDECIDDITTLTITQHWRLESIYIIGSTVYKIITL